MHSVHVVFLVGRRGLSEGMSTPQSPHRAPQPCGPPTCLSSLLYSVTHSLTHLFISWSLIHSVTHLLIHLLSHPARSHSFTHLATHSGFLSHTHSATHSFTFSQGLSARQHWRREGERGRLGTQSQLSGGPHPHLAPHLGDLNDVWNVQIGLHRGKTPADEVGFVSFLSVHLARVLLRVDSHRADAQLRAGPEHTDGDLA